MLENRKGRNAKKQTCRKARRNCIAMPSVRSLARYSSNRKSDINSGTVVNAQAYRCTKIECTESTIIADYDKKKREGKKDEKKKRKKK